MFKVRLTVGSKRVPGTVAGAGITDENDEVFKGDQRVDTRGLPEDGMLDNMERLAQSGNGLETFSGTELLDLSGGLGLSGPIELGGDGFAQIDKVKSAKPKPATQEAKVEPKKKKDKKKHQSDKHSSSTPKKGKAQTDARASKDRQAKKNSGKNVSAPSGGDLTDAVAGGVLVHAGREIESGELKDFKAPRTRRNKGHRSKGQNDGNGDGHHHGRGGRGKGGGRGRKGRNGHEHSGNGKDSGRQRKKSGKRGAGGGGEGGGGGNHRQPNQQRSPRSVASSATGTSENQQAAKPTSPNPATSPAPTSSTPANNAPAKPSNNAPSAAAAAAAVREVKAVKGVNGAVKQEAPASKNSVRVYQFTEEQLLEFIARYERLRGEEMSRVGRAVAEGLIDQLAATSSLVGNDTAS